MTGKQIALLRRELWEHRAIYVAPLVIALIVTMMSITGQVAISAFDHVVDMAILGATNIGETERSSALTVLLTSMSSVFVLTMWVVIIFYTLDCLYSERKDKSILFWRSIPVTDAETVTSKLLTALFVIPAITFAVIIVTHLAVLGVSSIWIEIRGADAFHLLWRAAPLLDNWT
ncbi:MAG: ABC-2 transporter permease, partial [Woeseiaceae bacterium]